MSAVSDAIEKHTTKPEGNVEALRQERRVLHKKRQGLFGFEKDIQDALDTRIKTLDSKIAALASGHGYPRLDPVVLTWRHDKYLSWWEEMPVPKLAPLPLDQTTAFLGRKRSDTFSMPKGDCNLPAAVRGKDYYSDIDEKFKSMWGDRSLRMRLTFTYAGGAMPDELRSLIVIEKTNFQEIFLLAEAPRETWRFTHERRSRREIARGRAASIRAALRDPIVVGYDGHHLWVLGSFDPTPVEQYVMEEFTTKQ